MSADSAADAWAIGTIAAEPMVQHWDGARWTQVPVQTPGADVNHLNAVEALSPSDVWVVGDYSDDGTVFSTLVEHWDGTSFTVIPSPNPDSTSNGLYGIAGVSSDAVWAVGSQGRRYLVERWDGSTWSVQPAPSRRGAFVDISALAQDSLLTIGYRKLWRWDGQAWTTIAKTSEGYLEHMSSLSATASWVEGENDGPSSFAGLLDGEGLKHDTGTCSYSKFGDITALADDDVWLVGYCNHGIALPSHTYASVDHWNGSSWRSVRNHVRGFLHGVDGTSSDDVWAVGDDFDGNALIEHWDGSAWSVSPTG